MDQDRWIAGALPLLALAMMLGGLPHAFGRTLAASHGAAGITVADVAHWMLSRMAQQADIEAGEAEAQQALVSMIFGGAPMGPLAAEAARDRRPAAAGSEVGGAVPTD